MEAVLSISGNSNNISWNRQLANELDAMDGKKDGVIKANVWNNFIKKSDSSGKNIGYFINVDEAAQSLNFYARRKDAGKVDWKNWKSLLEAFKKDIPIHIDNSDVTVSKTHAVPDDVSTEAKFLFKKTEIPKYEDNKERAEKLYILQDGKYYSYNSQGKIEKVYNTREDLKEDNPDHELFYDEQGNLTAMFKYQYNDGEPAVTLEYGAEGDLTAIYKKEYDENGQQTGIIEYNKDGAVDSFGVYEYDKDGNILVSSYDKDGNLTDVSKQLNNDINVLYDTNGKYQHGYKTEYTEDANGNIKSHKDYCWSRKGNLLKR